MSNILEWNARGTEQIALVMEAGGRIPIWHLDATATILGGFLRAMEVSPEVLQ